MMLKLCPDAEAIAMMSALSGRSHHVTSGVALLHRSSTTQAWTECLFHQVTTVTFGKLEQAEIEAYVAAGAQWDVLCCAREVDTSGCTR
jgi:septum formation protein